MISSARGCASLASSERVRPAARPRGGPGILQGCSMQPRRQRSPERPPVLVRVDEQPAPELMGHNLARQAPQYMASLSPTAVKGTL